MKRSVLVTAATVVMGLFVQGAFAQTQKQDTAKKTTTTTTTTTTATAKDTSAKDIVATLANVAEETTLTTAIKTSGLDVILKGAGPYTILAPANDAFNVISKTKSDSLMKDPVKLGNVVKAHIISGKLDKAALIDLLKAGKGTATLKTIDGQTIKLSVVDKKLTITDAQGTAVQVTYFDTHCTNGVIHGVNGVLMAK